MTSELATTPPTLAPERLPAAATSARRGLGCWLRTHAADVAAWAGLALLGVVLFRYHLSGAALFLGTSDRVNGALALRKFMVDGIHQLGHVPGWNDSMFLGFALDAGGYLPVNDPLGYLLALFPVQQLFVVYGYVAFGVFVLTAWCAYLYIKDACGKVFPAFVGSSLCALSSYSIIRIGQIDPIAMTLIQMPLGLWILRRLQRGKTPYWLVGLTVVLWTLLSWSF